MTKRRTIHLDATKAGAVLRTAQCGWLDVDTTTDITAVTCGSCRQHLRTGAKPATARSRITGTIGSSELNAELLQAVAAVLQPKAGPPPRLTPALWDASCVRATRRCGSCELCAWEREAERWAFSAPWLKQHRVRRPSGAPAWRSLAAALVALADWEHHDRSGPSAMGPMLERIARGAVGDGGASRPEDPLLRRAGELVRVRQALEEAYEGGAELAAVPEGPPVVLSRAECMRVLLMRTAGVLEAVPTYEELSAQLRVTRGELRALVRRGRRYLTVDLAARGLIPPPHSRAGLAEAIESARERFAHAC